MTNFRDPAVVAKDGLASVKLWHVVDGIFIWEFFTTLNYEWSIIKGQRPYRWTIWIYSLTRMAALMAVIVNLIDLNLTAPIDCQVSVTLEMVPSYLALSSASLLLVIRIRAIWMRNRGISVLAFGLWGINGSSIIYGISRLRSTWVATRGMCVAPNIESAKITMIVAFVTDILLVLIMLAGLVCMRCSAFATGRLLWNQGVIWLLCATITGVVPTVFICLDLNDPLNVMFQIPWLITMSIAATWMYRKLTDIGTLVISRENPPPSTVVVQFQILEMRFVRVDSPRAGFDVTAEA